MHADKSRSCYARIVADLFSCSDIDKRADERGSDLLEAWRTGESEFRGICLARHSRMVREVLRNVWRLVKSICARVFLDAHLSFHLRGCGGYKQER